MSFLLLERLPARKCGSAARPVLRLRSDQPRRHMHSLKALVSPSHLHLSTFLSLLNCSTGISFKVLLWRCLAQPTEELWHWRISSCPHEGIVPISPRAAMLFIRRNTNYVVLARITTCISFHPEQQQQYTIIISDLE